MKGLLIVFVIAFAIGILLMVNNKEQQQPQKSAPVTTERQSIEDIEKDLSRKLEEIREKQLKDYLSPAQSRVWLRNNYFEVHRTGDGRGYTITANYYDPGPPSRRYGGKTTITGQSTGSISGPQSALVTIDPEGQLRVRPDNH